MQSPVQSFYSIPRVGTWFSTWPATCIQAWKSRVSRQGNRQRHPQTIAPGSCLVIEDSIPGLRGAKAAGMKVLAVANTHTIQDLHEAHAVAQSLSQVRLSELRERLWPKT